jgi:hypothetical protein
LRTARCAIASRNHSRYPTARAFTTIACAYEQQYANILNYGEAFDATTFYDADGIEVGTVSRSCDSWWLGTDPDGVDVIINGSTGEVRSHGLVHSGEALSHLPNHLVLPLATRATE